MTSAPVPSPTRSPTGGSRRADLGRAARDRPSLSIRTRLSLGFLSFFAVGLGITLATRIVLRRIDDKLQFLESTASYSFEIQQARRYEKNYFLYGTGLDAALLHVQKAEAIVTHNRGPTAAVVGAPQASAMVDHLRRYEQLLQQLQRLDTVPSGERATRLSTLEADIRRHGAEMVRVADSLMAQERRSINALLRVTQRVPLVFLALLLPLVLYMASFLTRQILGPLNRMMRVTTRVAEGDFTPLPPGRRYRDEFTELRLAMNHMMEQIVKREELLVQAHRLQAVGTLTAGIAHELNNPLNNLMLTAAMLQEEHATLPPHERLEMATDMVEQTERMQHIVRRLLDFSRDHEPGTELRTVRELVEDTLPLAANELRLAGIKVRREFADDLPPVRGDPQRLTQVLLNLILNAADAMPEGGILTLATGWDGSSRQVALSISDTGQGIPPSELSSLFDPFYTTKPAGKGTGLGLSVSLSIVREHGGEIQVTSEVGNGTTFTVLLPAAQPEEA